MEGPKGLYSLKGWSFATFVLLGHLPAKKINVTVSLSVLTIFFNHLISGSYLVKLNFC